MKTALNTVRLIALAVWVGGLAFFAFVLAPLAFHQLAQHDAGLLVGSTLNTFHWIAEGCAALFLLSTMLLPNDNSWRHPAQVVLATAMLVTTLFSQLRVIPAMERDRQAAGGDIHLVAVDALPRVDFDRLHHLSEQMEGGVLLLGLCVAGLIAAELSIPASERTTFHRLQD